MQERIHEIIEIENLKDMLNKSGEIYGDYPAFKFKTAEEGKFDIITHKEFRDMINCLRNIINKIRLKRKKNSCYW